MVSLSKWRKQTLGLAKVGMLFSAVGLLIGHSPESPGESACSHENLEYDHGYCVIGDVAEERLANLQGRKHIDGSLVICDSSLTNLDALSELETISGNLVICHNPYLESIQGLSRLSSIGKGLSLDANYELKSLSGLEELSGSLTEISLNSLAIESLVPLSQLTEVTDSIHLFNLPIVDLQGLENLSPFTGSLTLHLVDALSLSELVIGSELEALDITTYLANTTYPDFNLLEKVHTHLSLTSAYEGEELTASLSFPLLEQVTESVGLYSYNATFTPEFNQLKMAKTLDIRNKYSGESAVEHSNFPALATLDRLSLEYKIADAAPRFNALTKVNYLRVVGPFDSLEQFDGFYVDGELIIANTMVKRLPKVLFNPESHIEMLISSNDQLLNFDGLSHSYISSLIVRNNPLLVSIEGLGEINSINVMRLVNNPSLERIDIFENVKSMDRLVIQDNESIASLNAFAELETIFGLIVINNSSLTELGLESLRLIGNDFTIRSNSNLCQKLVYEFIDQLDNRFSEDYIRVSTSPGNLGNCT